MNDRELRVLLRLKPASFGGLSGTAEAVPYPKPFVR